MQRRTRAVADRHQGQQANSLVRPQVCGGKQQGHRAVVARPAKPRCPRQRHRFRLAQRGRRRIADIRVVRPHPMTSICGGDRKAAATSLGGGRRCVWQNARLDQQCCRSLLLAPIEAYGRTQVVSLQGIRTGCASRTATRPVAAGLPAVGRIGRRFRRAGSVRGRTDAWHCRTPPPPGWLVRGQSCARYPAETGAGNSPPETAILRRNQSLAASRRQDIICRRVTSGPEKTGTPSRAATNRSLHLALGFGKAGRSRSAGPQSYQLACFGVSNTAAASAGTEYSDTGGRDYYSGGSYCRAVAAGIALAGATALDKQLEPERRPRKTCRRPGAVFCGRAIQRSAAQAGIYRSAIACRRVGCRVGLRSKQPRTPAAGASR